MNGGVGRADPPTRRILHVDMDAFFVGVELLDRPELAGRPVVVGGTGGRGVVAAASYEARAYGVHSAMPTSIARRRCPDAVFLPGRHDRYARASEQVMAIFRELTPLVEPLSLDEAFLDVTGRVRALGPAHRIAADLRRSVVETTGLWSSVGVATSKFLAKLGSKRAKPAATPSGPVRGTGVFEIPPGRERAFLEPMPLEELWGVGPATLTRLHRLGLRTVGDLARVPPEAVRSAVGASHGDHLVALANARDDRPVVPDAPMKSVSHEETFATDLVDAADLHRVVVRLADAVGARLRSAGTAGRTVQIKVRDPGFATLTRSCTLDAPTADGRRIAAVAQRLLDGVDTAAGVRLLGVGVHQLGPPPALQLTLALDDVPGGDGDVAADPAAHDDAEQVVDDIRRRFGRSAIGPAVLLADRRLGTFEAGAQQWGPTSDGT